MKYFFKQYWRYIAMALAFATFNFLINACEVKAEINFINPPDMTYKNPLGSNPTYGTNCSPDGYSCIYLDNGLQSYSRFYTGNAGYNFPYTQLAVFNFSLVRRDSDQDTSIGSISLNGYSCYFTTTNDYTSNTQGSGDQSLEPYKTNASAYCPLSGTFIINGRTKILEIRYTNQANISYVMLNRITFVSNGEVDRLIQLLSSSNGYFVTNNDLLSQINSKLGTIISNEQATTNAINNQTQQQHSDAEAQKEATDNINDSINNSNTEGGQTQANDFFNNFNGGDTGSLMDLVSLPLDFLDSLNNTCSPINITIPYFNQSFQLPCLRASLTNAFGGVVSIIVLVINALLCYRLIKGFIDIIHNLKDPNNDEIEVMDL